MRDFASPRLRVLALTPGLAPGGAEQHLTTLIRHAQRVKYTGVVSVGDIGQHLSAQLPGVPVISGHVERDTERTVEQLVRKQLAGGIHCDLIMYWGFRPLDLSFAGVPVVHVMHASGVETPANQWDREYIRLRGQSAADCHVAVCSSGVQAFSEEVRKRHRITVIHNGADCERSRPIHGGAWQREQWGIPADAKVVLYNGRLFDGKGADIALEALQHLPSDYVLVIHGWGDQAEALRKRADGAFDAFQGKPRVYFPQPRTSGLGDVYAAADVVVLPSASEAFPLVLIEAWQAGVPVVCSEFSTLLEIEQSYAHGQPLATHVPCPPTPGQLAEAIVGVDESTVPRAAEIALTRFTASAMVGRWESYFYDVVSRWQRQGRLGLVQAARVRDEAANVRNWEETRQMGPRDGDRSTV